MGARLRGKLESAAARRAAESKAQREREISVGTPPTAVSALVGEGTAVGMSGGTPPTTGSALVVESPGTDATGVAANQDTCASQGDGGMLAPTSGSGARADAPKAKAETVRDAAFDGGQVDDDQGG